MSNPLFFLNVKNTVKFLNNDKTREKVHRLENLLNKNDIKTSNIH